LNLNLFLSIFNEKRVSYQQYINGPHSRNNGQETTEKDTAIRGSNFLKKVKERKVTYESLWQDSSFFAKTSTLAGNK
jgi:hypothetical protein